MPVITAASVVADLRSSRTLRADTPTPGPGSLSVTADDEVIVIAFDYGAAHGSIGRAEADQLVRAIKLARADGKALVFLLETSGIRVTDGTAGIASARRILRAATDARLDGIRMLAVILRCSYGGASILASLCERRLILAESRVAMSGPRLIAASGDGGFDADDRDAVDALIGGRARAATGAFDLVEDDASAVARTIDDWLQSPPRAVDLAGDADALARRLARDPAAPTDGRVLRLATPSGTTAADALELAHALRTATAGAVTVAIDTPGHAATPDDERVGLSDFLAHLALLTRQLGRDGRPVEVVVDGVGGGGILAALAAGASAVTMRPAARLVVLPPTALAALSREQGADEGRLAEALTTGVVDAEQRQWPP